MFIVYTHLPLLFMSMLSNVNVYSSVVPMYTLWTPGRTAVRCYADANGDLNKQHNKQYKHKHDESKEIVDSAVTSSESYL